MRKRCVTLVACGVALALSRPVRTQERQPSNDDELRKLDATLGFIRKRNAADYAISTPIGIDEAKYLTSLAKAFVDGVEAPHKAFVPIKGGHFAVFMNASEFLKELSALLAITAR